MDKRAETSAENGKMGGRPVSEATLRTQFARDYISKQVEDSLGAIVAKAITMAIEGNEGARNWLSDRAWGKAQQAIDFTTLGEKLTIDDNQFRQLIGATKTRTNNSKSSA